MINNIERISSKTRNIVNQFYQKRWYYLTKLYPNAMDEVRKVKPNVPLVGENGIPLRDEIQLEKNI